ncbi:transmembrane protein 183-like isoform X4 [Polyodon spathula]|uniref:transmembrane protein 183-like isoform X4 n=1 Tax=Polyodon spathula TaxID=7913 RepID=UPI001B7DC0C2|nr:transmembrane protein 183-like isoform X4 [Polyodon spathula]
MWLWVVIVQLCIRRACEMPAVCAPSCSQCKIPAPGTPCTVRLEGGLKIPTRLGVPELQSQLAKPVLTRDASIRTVALEGRFGEVSRGCARCASAPRWLQIPEELASAFPSFLSVSRCLCVSSRHGRSRSLGNRPQTPPAAAAMPKKGRRKRLKFRAEGVCSESDYANSDPAVVRSGRVKKAVANAIEKEVKLLCGLEASHGPVEEVLSSITGVGGQAQESSDELDAEDCTGELRASRKKKSKRHKVLLVDADAGDGAEYPVDVWLLLASYIRPEDICKFALICKNAWAVSCTAAFWSRLYKRHYISDAHLPARLQPDSMGKVRGLRARVIRSLYHLYEPFCSRVSRSPSIPESTPMTVLNSKCLLFWVNKIVGSRAEPLWEFNFKFLKQPPKLKNGCGNGLQYPRQYQEVHSNPDHDCFLLQVTTLNFIFTPVVMGMTLTLLTVNVSTDMRHHRARLLFQDSPMVKGRKPRNEQGVQIVLDPVHSVRLVHWWHPQYPASNRT